MMRQIINFSDMDGKTIKKAGKPFDENILITFIDDTFFFCEALPSYEESFYIKSTQLFSFLQFSQETVIEYGLCTENEYCQLKLKDQHMKEKQVEKEDRDTYERLKRKFGIE